MIRPQLIILALLSVLLLSTTGVRAQAPTPQGTPLGSGFTYQGQLKKGGKAFDGTCDFQFSLYDVATGGNQTGTILTQTGIKVVNGVFATKLDFGANVFTGEARWLQVAVKCPGDEGFVIFNTRQELTPTPYALGLRLPLDQITNSDTAMIIRNMGGRAIVGITTAFATAVEGNGTTGDGVIGTSNSGRGVTGVSQSNDGMYAKSISGNGLHGVSNSNSGVFGESTDGNGLYGVSTNQNGVVGISTNRIGVVGEAQSRDGVFGSSVEAVGVVGTSKNGRGVVGISPNNIAVWGESRTRDGVYGVSVDANGIYGVSTNDHGIVGISTNGDGVFGRSTNGYAGFFDGKVRVKTLEIAGGADLAEPFDVTGASNDQIIPGTVVCIDPTHPGKLVVCTNAYDRTVAGIISGAGGVQPGMVMRQNGSAADGQHSVALTGRVYVWADATQQPIRPGDLLTTSATPGHAAKATDHDAAQGAIIGKAMSSLEGGKGLVLVLVGLN